MNKLSFFVCSIALAITSSARAQEVETPAPSPKAKVEQRAGVTDFYVEYSSPGVKGRKIWGELVPMDKVWRTGANSATVFGASKDFTFGDKVVPAGKYALFTIPGKSSWTIILNTNQKQWGSTDYDQTQDVARMTVKPATSGHRERMTFIFSDTTDDGTRLDLEWEKVRVSIPLKVDTKGHVAKTLDESWRSHANAARYLVENNGDLDRAMQLVDASIMVKPTWMNQWVRAQVLGKKGKKTDAVSSAEKAMELGKGNQTFESFFKPNVEKALADWRKGS
jgi:hypothetical protein